MGTGEGFTAAVKNVRTQERKVEVSNGAGGLTEVRGNGNRTKRR